MRAVGIAETALQKRPRPPYFDKPPEQSAGCRLVRTPKISAGIFSHLSALSPFALSGCGHRGGTGGGRILFHPDKRVGSRKIRPAVSNNALLWPGLVLCKRRSFFARHPHLFGRMANGGCRTIKMFGDFMQTGIRMPPDISSRFLPIRFGGI
ncbi:hypothetical protein TFGA2_01510 [Neisseria gonorrhoeae]|uniref:Uncharacterized protein n=1 Tax=Neisseria gonorrhoeae TaxID=485 RepID=A0AB74EHK5_NEIGO|nr:hypothetical protein NGFG_02424 [Neisseria gonorrhoeae MS11]AKP12891.1 hypothetical protein WX60_00988 [Neisseria gonorrhoeae]AKP14524.1 hypothetical protein WX61_00442 [Neisseria gonorrhoeae]KAE9493631.1 hypothetical protein F9Z35_1576 [Neisseria gonorrhoeae]KAE9493760.1 hypothetical protein F9Z35_1707 [Neisseria gonorrhoeae]